MKILQISLLIVYFAVIAFPQQTESLTELKGTVMDQAGAVIPSTRVVLSDSKGKTFESLTDGNGAYLVRVPVGTYALQAEYTKHQAWEKFRIERYEVAATKRMILDICLAVDKKFTELRGTPLTAEPDKVLKKPPRR